MRTQTLGQTSLQSSRLAYGCWRIATRGDAAADYETARAAIFAAVDAGYELFDHADIYCDGEAERVFGRILRESPGLRARMVIATKGGIRFKNRPAGAPVRYDFSRGHLLAQAELSLRQLGVETIDLLHLHRPDYLMDADEVAGAFAELRQSGKVREFGVSNFSPSQFSLLQSRLPFPLAVNQVEVSLLQLDALHDGTLDQCQQLKVTPLAWSPLGAGLLGSGGKDLLPGQAHYNPKAILPVLDRIAGERGVTREVVALAWLLKHPSRLIPIVGSTNPARIRQHAAADQLELTREEWYHLVTAARGAEMP
ncbi:MAG: aldo/keto reductase [Verrucomicrobiota bacterium]|jgi:predicted oxidoreductase